MRVCQMTPGFRKNESVEIKADAREVWEKPTIVELPPLTELTLQSVEEAISGQGGTSGGGSLIFW